MQSVRLIRVLCDMLSEQRGYTVAEYSFAYNVNRRTAFRDISRLRKAGVPIEYDRNDGRWKLNHPVAQMPNLQGGWPLGWSETVLLLAAVFRFTQHSYREEMGRNIINDLEPWISRSFTNQFGSIAVNARMLAGNPKLAVERTHELISRLSKG